ncbi:sensor histidine kinase [Lysinibacillus yapensis]|uniref:histidine kinase n=1 Tax=Ureibacillus yapensis TaxID=2304605 RepID=A0A396S463_9BACL|nr:HAMP domain-containing sensor histidine kinase [Lysinibacillus yapensis]RHW32051.1 sensor histidine kinase [Lysinibacillus yapensis]
MRVQWLVAIVVVIFVGGITFTFITLENKNSSKVDLPAINDVVKTIEKNWGYISEDSFRNSQLNQSFSIIDNKESVIFQTPGEPFAGLYDSIKNRDIVIDVKQDNRIVGKVIFHNSEQQTIQKIKKELAISVSSIFALLMIVSIFYILYLYKTILKPFQQLRIFAANVARGNLDVPLIMDKSNSFGAFTESFDIMREELEAARQREYESNQSKKELVATLSHDIKTPVSSIKAVSELMLLQAKDEKVIKHVNTIYSKAEQINLLITDMFHATLEELQQLKLKVTEESSELLVSMIENVNYDDLIDYDSVPPCIILMDPVRMQQVIDNIISNSYKYAGTKILIQSKVSGGYLELSIKDFGPGIHEEELPMVFNKYYRGKNVAGKNGSGLGLYISKYFMENMNGQIDGYNREDGFTIVLKIKLA